MIEEESIFRVEAQIALEVIEYLKLAESLGWQVIEAFPKTGVVSKMIQKGSRRLAEITLVREGDEVTEVVFSSGKSFSYSLRQEGGMVRTVFSLRQNKQGELLSATGVLKGKKIEVTSVTMAGQMITFEILEDPMKEMITSHAQIMSYIRAHLRLLAI